MTSAQLDQFQKKLSCFQEAELITIDDEEKSMQYLIVWWLADNKRYRMDYIFIIYNDNLLKRIEIDGYLRSYVLQALEQILKK